MNGKFFWLTTAAIAVSFAGGFLLANAFNRREIDQLRTENGRLTNAADQSVQNDTDGTLSDEEIRAKIAEADKNPTNAPFQRNLGLALYRYAAMKQDADLLAEIGRLLTRVYEKNPKDYDVLITLGNINFDIGYSKKDDAQFEKAREFYGQALEQKNDDIEVLTDYGLTYFFVTTPDYAKAVAAFQKSLQINPRHEKTLQAMAETMLKQNKVAEAEKYVARLKQANAGNQSLAQLESQIAGVKSGAQN